MGLFAPRKRSLDERMFDEVNDHLKRTGKTLEEELQLIGDKKSTLTASLRRFVVEGYQAHQEKLTK